MVSDSHRLALAWLMAHCLRSLGALPYHRRSTGLASCPTPDRRAGHGWPASQCRVTAPVTPEVTKVTRLQEATNAH